MRGAPPRGGGGRLAPPPPSVTFEEGARGTRRAGRLEQAVRLRGTKGSGERERPGWGVDQRGGTAKGTDRKDRRGRHVFARRCRTSRNGSGRTASLGRRHSRAESHPTA